jgi:hypothetical protein
MSLQRPNKSHAGCPLAQEKWSVSRTSNLSLVGLLLAILPTERDAFSEELGLIQSFKYTYELAWNTLKDLFDQQGESNILGSRDAFRLAFQRGLIENGEAWMDMVKSRSLTSHTYNETVSGHSKPATKGRMKTSHFEGSIACWAACAARGRNERTQCELAAYDNYFGGQWLVQPADCA